MRRRIQLGIGVLEAALASVLFVIGWLLPRPDSVETSFKRVQHVTIHAETQVQRMREQLAAVRQNDFPRIRSHLRSQTHGFSAKWARSSAHFPTVESFNDNVMASANGLEEWSVTLDPDGWPLRSGAKTSLPESLARATSQTRTAMIAFLAHLDTDCRALVVSLESAPDVAAQIKALVATQRLLNRLNHLHEQDFHDRLIALRQRTDELESTLATAHKQLECAADAEIPLLVPTGSTQPMVQLVPLWPQGKQAARNLGATVAAVRLVNRQLELLSQWPEQMPSGQSTSLARRLNQVRVLADALQGMFDRLRQAILVWPELVQSMRFSAGVLRDSHERLDNLAGRQSELDRVVRRGRDVSLNAEQLVDTYADRIADRLAEQEHSLAEMRQGIGEAREAIPAVAQTTADLLNAIRWMFWLVGGLLALHGAFVFCEARAKDRIR